jgi:DNA-binding Lrp family transcriptional regulator
MALKQKELALIEALLANPSISNEKVAEMVGINRNTVREWKKKPEFNEVYKKKLREKWESSEAIAVDTMRKLAVEGDFKASKYILDSLGYAPVTKIEADVNQDINIVVEE